MVGYLRYAIVSSLLLFCSTEVYPQCAAGDEVCLQEATEYQAEGIPEVDPENASSAVENPITPNPLSPDQVSADQVTTDTYTEEQSDLVAAITGSLKRHRLTRPAGGNAYQQIQRLQVIHPTHDYSVNGTKYIARILMSRGQSALRNGDPDVASDYLQRAIDIEPRVERQQELKDGIAAVTGTPESTQESTVVVAQGLQAESTSTNSKDASPVQVDEVTTETYTPEESELVAGITRNLQRRSLTSPVGDNAFEKIQRLQKIHPLHDYSVNGTKYIARIFMVLGRSAMRNGNPELAQQRLQNAIQFDPQVGRQGDLRNAIAAASANPEPAPVDLAQTVEDTTTASEAPDVAATESEITDTLIAAEEAPVIQPGEITTETSTAEQDELVAGITRDLKSRNLISPIDNNALEKIERLKDIHPRHDYAVNGTKYIARITMVLGRAALRDGDLDLATRHMLKAIQFDSEVARHEQLKTAIADAARKREAERETREIAEQETSVTAYLSSDSSATRRAPLPADVKFVAPVMVAIPAGNYLMGSDNGAEDEKPVHHVVLEAFSMSKHEVTVQQYRVFALTTGRPAPQYRAEESNLPATNVSWDDAVAYTEWLSKKTKRLFRLPTEAEWEYSARAGTTSEYFTGDSLRNAANCVGCDDQWGGKSVSPVGSFDPNEFGLYDAHGNVWEWVQDCWSDNYDGRSKAPSAFEIEGCNRRVLRGGSWYNDADYARASYRGNEVASFRDGGVGFRVVHEGL